MWIMICLSEGFAMGTVFFPLCLRNVSANQRGDRGRRKMARLCKETIGSVVTGFIILVLCERIFFDDEKLKGQGAEVDNKNEVTQ